MNERGYMYEDVYREGVYIKWGIYQGGYIEGGVYIKGGKYQGG